MKEKASKGKKVALLSLTIFMAIGLVSFVKTVVRADGNYFDLSTGNFSQNWTNTGLITTNDDWSGVPSIIGYRGDDLITTTAIDPQTVLTESSVVDVNANQINGQLATGGVSEFEITNPTIGLAGSGTADAPYIQLFLNTTGRQTIIVSYNVRDLDDSTDNAVQQVALQYRVGTTGNFTNIPGGFVSDATTQGTATQVTAVSATLPAAAENQSQVQVRIITTNAAGNDEYVGIDDIVVTSVAAAAAPTNDLTISQSAPTTVTANSSFSYTLTVTNTGTASFSNVDVNFTLPTGVTYVSASSSCTGATTAPALGGTGTVNFTGCSVAANGGTTVLTVTVTAPSTAQTITSNGTAVVVDPSNSVAETNNSNNNATTFTTNVTVGSTAAMVNVGGRVTNSKGRGISGATVSMTDGNGNIYSAVTDSLGNYLFEGVEVGQTLIFNVQAKRITFTQPSQVVSLTEETITVNFTGYEAKRFGM